MAHDPCGAAMMGPAKVFWKDVSVAPERDGFGVFLDARQLRTPAKSALVVPTADLAAQIAAEWRALTDRVDPANLPFTRMANAAIDKIAPQKSEVSDLLVAYGDADLLCYRAAGPAALVARQAACWDPVLDWADTVLGARLMPHVGVVHVAQDRAAISQLTGHVDRFSNFELAALHDLVSLSGSLILAFAATRSWRSPEQLWDWSRIDETWQIEQWGEDNEAMALELTKRQAFLHAKKFFHLLAKGA